MGSFFRWPFSRRSARRALIALVIVLVLCVLAVIVAITVVNLRGEQHWREYAAAARERGVKLSFDEFVPPAVVDAENYAAAPIFAEMLRASRAGKPEPLARIEADEYTKYPEFGGPSSGRRTDLADWVRFLNREGQPAPGARPSVEESAMQILESLKKFDPVMHQMEEAAQRPVVCFPVNWEAGDIGADHTHLTLIRRAGLIYSLRLRAHTRLGDGEAAIGDAHSLLSLRRVLEREPTLVPSLTRLSITAHFCNGVWEGLVGRIWNDAQLSTLTQELVRIDFAQDYRFLLESQRASENRFFDLLLDPHAPNRLRVLSAFEDLGIGINQSKLRYLPLLKGWARGNQWRLNQYFDELLSTIDDAQGNIRPAPPHSSPLFHFENIVEVLQYAVFNGMGPPFGGIGQRFAHGETLKRQAQIGCALERYRLLEAKYPNSLDSLAPNLLLVIPKEVLVDADFHYEVTADGEFRLYSMALNRKDDGGRKTAKKRDRGTSWNKQLDWLWLHVEQPDLD